MRCEEKQFEKVYQFKITLRDTKPPIWRRIQVPEIYTFWDLHVAIQDSMGWLDYHLHEFEVTTPSIGAKVSIGIPDDEGWREVIPGWKRNICDFFSIEKPKAHYTYDFGDTWKHLIELEKILPREKNIDYPICIDGRRACPPEDCGGPWGYKDFLEAIRDPKHRRHKELLEWIGGKFDSEYFDAKKIKFTDPEKYRKKVFAERE